MFVLHCRSGSWEYIAKRNRHKAAKMRDSSFKKKVYTAILCYAPYYALYYALYCTLQYTMYALHHALYTIVLSVFLAYTARFCGRKHALHNDVFMRLALAVLVSMPARCSCCCAIIVQLAEFE
jgi:hypothetical protein